MIDHGAVVSLLRILKLSFADLAVMVPHALSPYLGRAFSTCLMMCSGCFPSTATGRPNVFGKTLASPRVRGNRANRPSGPSIVLKGPGLRWRRLGRNGSRARAVEQLLLDQLRVRRWRCQMESCNTTKTIRSSERDLGRLGWPARTGPEARLLGAGGASLPCHPEAVSAAITAAVEWRLMIEANTCRTHWQNGVGNEKLEIICKKFDQISQTS